MPRTDNWHHGDPLTMEFSGVVVTGTAVVFRRRSDQQRFVKVHITSGPKAGTDVWPGERWVIGQGQTCGSCLECGQPYRTAEASPAGFCPPCDRRAAAERAGDSGIRKPGAYLRGTPTPTRRPRTYTDEELAAIAAQKAQDEREQPF